jgi:hypothetical protein
MIFQSLANYETGAYLLDKKALISFSSKRRAYKEITVFFIRVLLKSVTKRLLSLFKYLAPIPIIFYLNNQVKIQEPFFYVKTEVTASNFTENLANTYDVINEGKKINLQAINVALFFHGMISSGKMPAC